MVAERGLFLPFLNGLSSDSIDIYFGPEANLPSRIRLVTRQVELESGQVVDIGWQHFWPVLAVIFIGLIAGIIALVCEKFTARNYVKPEPSKPDFIPTAQLGGRLRHAVVRERKMAAMKIQYDQTKRRQALNQNFGPEIVRKRF